MFEITVHRSFDAGHALHLGGRLSEVPHQHRWECEVTVAAEELDQMGLAVDFFDVEKALGQALEPLTGKQLHEIEVFSEASPSAENVALYLFCAMTKQFQRPGARVVRARVWEDAHHSATYSE